MEHSGTSTKVEFCPWGPHFLAAGQAGKSLQTLTILRPFSNFLHSQKVYFLFFCKINLLSLDDDRCEISEYSTTTSDVLFARFNRQSFSILAISLTRPANLTNELLERLVEKAMIHNVPLRVCLANPGRPHARLSQGRLATRSPKPS